MASTDATFVPVKNQAYRLTFPILDADGDLVTGATSPDSEVSKDGGTFADCTNEATEIATASGMYYLDLTATEMNADTVAVIIKSGNGKTVPVVMYPQESGAELKCDVTLISGDATAADNLEAYSDGTTPQPVNVTHFGGSTGTFASGRPEANTSHIAGSAVSTTSAQIGVNVVQISTDATAADNLEAAYDGAGYAGGTIPQQVILTTSGNNAVADQVWDEAMSGHVAAGSAGAAQMVIRSATALASGTDATHLALDASASAVDDFYNNQKLVILSGTGALQSRFISGYVGSTKIATVSTWATTPDGTSVYAILPFGSIPGATAPTAGEVADAVWDEAMAGHTTEGTYGALAQSMGLQVGTAQAGASSSITLDATGVPSSSATSDAYKYQMITIRSGTGIGQTRQITAYNGTTKVATVNLAWTTNPSSDSEYVVHPGGLDAATIAALADAVWDEARSGHVTAGSFGEYVLADATRLSGDSTAADNAEAFFDGTGYAGTNNVIPTVTSVTNAVSADVTKISGDTTAADNAESFFDGTGYAGTNNVIPTVTAVSGAVGSVTGAVGSVTGAVGSVTGAVGSVTGNVGGNVTGSVGSLAAQAKADVNAEVLDVLNVDTFAQPGQGTPAATNSIRAMVAYLFKAWRNRSTQTSSQYSLYNDDATTIDHKATFSDDATTASRGEVATGP